MEKKEPIKVKLSTAIVLCIIVIGIAVFTTIMILNNKSIISQKEKGADDTNQKISSMEKKIDDIKNNINIEETKEISDELVKESVEKYLTLISAVEGSTQDLLVELKMIKGNENFEESNKQGFLKTDIIFSDFKSKMLEYMTEKCYDNDFAKYFHEENGYLCYQNSGATGINYEVTSVEKVSEKVYNVKAIWSQEETQENVSFDFGIDKINENIVIDYCKQQEIEKEQEDETSRSDFSFMSEFKNTVYQSERKDNDYLYRIEFDKNANPTITVEYISKNGSKNVETYKDFSNVSSDGAAGKVYVTFDYKKSDDAKSEENGEIIYSHVTDNERIGLKLSTTNGQEVDLYKER